MAMRDTTSWITENCDLNDDCDGTPPEDHLFPPEGRRVTFLAAEESRLIGGNQQDEETFVAIAAGTAVNVVIVDPDIHMVGVLLPDGQRVWAEPGNLTNTVTAIEVSPCADDGTNTSVVPEADAEFWTVYLRKGDLGAEALANYDDKERALWEARRLAVTSGVSAYRGDTGEDVSPL